MKFFYEVLSLSFLTVSAVIGAGFLSGREIAAFFGVECFLPFIALSFFITAVCFYLLFTAGAKEKSLTDLNARLFPAYKLVDTAVLIASFISAAGSLAGISSLFFSLTGIKIPVFSLIALMCANAVADRGIKGVEKISLLLTPLLVITVVFLIITCGKTDASVGKANVFTGTVKTFLYSFMNCFINLPAFIDGARGKSKTAHKISAVLSALLISLLGILIAAAIKGARTENSDMPLIIAVNNNPFFFVALIFALLTSLFSAYYPLHFYAAKGKTVKKIALFSAVFLLSLLGVKGIIDGLYPLIGGMGAIYLVRCALFLRAGRYKNIASVHNRDKKERKI